MRQLHLFHLFHLCLAITTALAAGLAGMAQAQEFPSKPVRLIVTFTQSGAADLTARVFGDKLAEIWKQSVVIENRIGGGGSIGAEAVFRAPADGYTLLLATNTHIINHVVYPSLGFDFTKDFPGLGLVTSARSPSLPEVPTVAESGIAQLKNFSLDNYYGFMAPPGTPPAILAKIEADIRRVAAMPDVRKKRDGAGLDMLVMSSGDMMRLIRADAEKYGKAAKLAGIKAE